MVAFSKEGIRLAALDIFIASVGGRTAFVNFDVAKVCDEFMKPLTRDMKSLYCDFLNSQDPSVVGEAQVFISYSRKYKFLDLVDTLRTHFGADPDIIIWLDLFSSNQHDNDGVRYEVIIEQFNHMVLMMSPWHGTTH